MRVLHTSDWHLGRSLYNRKRYDEFSAFLNWMLEIIVQEKADVLIVAGDIFDTGTPGNRAQELYYTFLCSISSTSCRHVLITAGNHDSPSFLDAPRDILKVLNVHVVGTASENPSDEVVVLYSKDQTPEAIICAVPYLRDRDIRTVEAGETMDQKQLKMIEGIKNHYVLVCGYAEQKQKEFRESGHGKVPIIATGHLFAAGGKTIDGDGVRELYIGSLAHVGTDLFPTSIDYLALGHLHVPQKVGGNSHIRYSGSPIAMGYGEANQQKIVLSVDFFENSIEVSEIPVPQFQKLERISGSLDQIIAGLIRIKEVSESIWVEVEYTGSEIVPNLREEVESIVEGSFVEVLRIINRKINDRTINKGSDNETLDDLEPIDVFNRYCLLHEVDESHATELKLCYSEIVQAILEHDHRAE